jgi:phosphatidylglycerol lysyltransferase
LSYPDPSSDRTHADASSRDLVLRFGWNATAYQILNRGIDHWRPATADRAAVIGYVRRRGVIVAAGAPVCAEQSLARVATEFESWAGDGGRRVCYFGAEERLRAALQRTRAHAAVAIGAQPVWDPHGWPDVVRRRQSLRAQLSRARNKGVVVSEWGPAAARGDAGLRECLNEWLRSKPLPPMHFLVEPDLLGSAMDDRLVFVAARGGRPDAFLVASPVPLRNGYLFEQVARRADAPNGTAELLIDAAMRALAARGRTYATLGLVALTGHAGREMAQNPLWFRVATGWARAHGRRFYNFTGLEAFRTKMEPDRWDPLYAIANEPRFTTATMYAAAGAFAQGSPAAALAKGLGKAVMAEARSLRRRERNRCQ